MTESTHFQVLRCSACSRLTAGPRQLCPACGLRTLAPYAVAGDGRLVSWTIIRRAPPRFKSEQPYVVAVVDLDAGVRVTGRLATMSGDLEVGSSVSLVGVTGVVPVFGTRDALSQST